MLSTVEMAIKKDPGLITDFDATYDEVCYTHSQNCMLTHSLYCRMISMMWWLMLNYCELRTGLRVKNG